MLKKIQNARVRVPATRPSPSTNKAKSGQSSPTKKKK